MLPTKCWLQKNASDIKVAEFTKLLKSLKKGHVVFHRHVDTYVFNHVVCHVELVHVILYEISCWSTSRCSATGEGMINYCWSHGWILHLKCMYRARCVLQMLVVACCWWNCLFCRLQCRLRCWKAIPACWRCRCKASVETYFVNMSAGLSFVWILMILT